jgi:hypothetical protein
MPSSRSKMLSILDLFDKASPVWSADAICERLRCSTSSGYRYIRELASRSADAHFRKQLRTGPADRAARTADERNRSGG